MSYHGVTKPPNCKVCNAVTYCGICVQCGGENTIPKNIWVIVSTDPKKPHVFGPNAFSWLFTSKESAQQTTDALSMKLFEIKHYRLVE